MGDLILILSVGLIIWWFFSPSKKRRSDHSNQPELTDTQRRWHASKARERLEDMSKDLTKCLEGLDPQTRQDLQKLMDMRDYITAHKRPFKFSEWLVWGVEPQFLTNYCTWAVVYFGGSFLPLLWGWPVSPFVMMLFWLYIDSMFYKQKLVLEVTEWNPEWHEKFGEKDK